MSLKYFEDGPTFPNELLDQLVAGEVVFLCGAGVSFPQLPGFKDLVEKTFDRLGLEMDVGEQAAFDDTKKSLAAWLGGLFTRAKCMRLSRASSRRRPLIKHRT
jgi:hypothetical protein